MAAFERLQLRAGIEAQLLAEHLAGRLEGPQRLRLPARRGRGRASGGRGVARAAVPRPRAASSSATSSASRPSRSSASTRSSSTVHRSSSSRAASRRSSPSSSEPSSGGPRQSAKAPRSTSTATVDVSLPSTPLGPAPPRRSKQRASISSSGTSRRYPPAAVTSASLSGPRRPAQLRHERLQGVGAAGRQVVAPELVGQALGLDRLACPHEEEEQQRALLGAPDGQVDVAIDDLELAEHPERHSRTLRPPGRPEPGLLSGQRRIRAPSGPEVHVGSMTSTATLVRRPEPSPTLYGHHRQPGTRGMRPPPGRGPRRG